MRKWIVVACLAVCFGGIGVVFWYQELQYATPTPVPADYIAVSVRQQIELPSTFAKDSAIYFHFFNPDCPCSRFNQKHFNELAKRFGDQLKVYAVIPEYADVTRARQMLDKNVVVIQDNDDLIARACGVYSTPQAVIVGQNHQMYFRGNYNKSRYCARKETNYAQIALIAFVAGQAPPVFEIAATRSYGCELPDDQKRFILDF